MTYTGEDRGSEGPMLPKWATRSLACRIIGWGAAFAASVTVWYLVVQAVTAI